MSSGQTLRACSSRITALGDLRLISQTPPSIQTLAGTGDVLSRDAACSKAASSSSSSAWV